MPCNTYQGNDIALHNKYEGTHEELANMLCRMIKEYERFYTINSMGKDIEAWWKDHKEWDDKRREKKDES